MISQHRIHFDDARRLDAVPSQSVHLVVTSPPYPMIEMWDDLFRRTPAIRQALNAKDGYRAFELMHRELDRVWKELHRVLIPGGIVCINIGDATRTLNDVFALYPNHSRTIAYMLNLGFTNLPFILWRKQTNAPNKFMGSGMMPPGAYVTLEHEYILIFRKGDKRTFPTPEEKANRRRSAFFWEERNQWFSDVWMDLKGTRQDTHAKALRQRSAAFPFELAYRLISMFSVMGDTVLDPFLGTGTTLVAAAAACRNSVGYELDEAFRPLIRRECEAAVEQGRRRIHARMDCHRRFIRERETAGKPVKHLNTVFGLPVMTRQETELTLLLPATMNETAADHYQVIYACPPPQAEGAATDIRKPLRPPSRTGQLELFD